MIGRRKKKQHESESDDPADGFGDVRLIRPGEPSALDETGEIDDDFDVGAVEGDAILAELSQAFDPGLDRTAPRRGATGRATGDVAPGDGAPGDGAPGHDAGDDAVDRVIDDGARRDAADDTRPTPSNAGSPGSGGRRATIAIGGTGDDLPDAVYLDDGVAFGDDSEGTVFIDDDGQGDAILPKDAAGRGIEPRLRQRRIGVRRAAGRRRLKWAAAVLLVVVLLVGALATLGSSLFSVEEVDVTGRRYADEAAVQAVVDDLEGTPVLLVDTDEAERRLEAIPWVEAARVRTDFPRGATIELRERVPLATVRGADGRYRILDGEGRVVAIETGQPIAPVLISGPATLDIAEGEFADVGYAAAASIVTKLTPTVRTRLDSITVTADGSDMRLILRNQLPTGEDGPLIEVRLGSAIGDNEQIEKLVRLERVLDDVDGSDTTVIDVSTDETTQL